MSLETLAFGPSSHHRQRIERGLGLPPRIGHDGDGGVADCTTFFTPCMLIDLAASKLFSLPPKTGQSLMAALSMPGSLRSMP